MKTTREELDSKLDYVNKGLKNKLCIEHANGYYKLCLFDGSRDIMTGTKNELWKALNAIEEVLYAENS